MVRTLQDLKNSIEIMIQEQGKDAPVAAWIYTQEDVFEIDENGDPMYFSIEDIGNVLNTVEEDDYINARIDECIDEEIRRLVK
jgi:hypothetical protein